MSITTAVKERPILFSGPMVKAILEGRKSVTRRIVKPQPEGEDLRICEEAYDWCVSVRGNMAGLTAGDHHWEETSLRCRFGAVGDRLWVRETWRPFTCTASPGCSLDYKATQVDHSDIRWRPSIHMPRWASRITLEITDVRVERPTEISGDDALAEGCWNEHGDPEIALSDFVLLWESINGPGSWERNDWLWVISFKRLEAKP